MVPGRKIKWERTRVGLEKHESRFTYAQVVLRACLHEDITTSSLASDPHIHCKIPMRNEINVAVCGTHVRIHRDGSVNILGARSKGHAFRSYLAIRKRIRARPSPPCESTEYINSVIVPFIRKHLRGGGAYVHEDVFDRTKEIKSKPPVMAVVLNRNAVARLPGPIDFLKLSKDEIVRACFKSVKWENIFPGMRYKCFRYPSRDGKRWIETDLSPTVYDTGRIVNVGTGVEDDIKKGALFMYWRCMKYITTIISEPEKRHTRRKKQRERLRITSSSVDNIWSGKCISSASFSRLYKPILKRRKKKVHLRRFM
jgi:hypothetical protein